jgi:acyl carrier protein
MVWGCFWFFLLVGAVALLVWLFDSNLRRGRVFQAELRERAAVPDEELVAQFFPDAGMSAEVPIRIRRLFAEGRGYPADRLLPDDDFGFILDELDAAPLLEELEGMFGIVIPAADAEATLPTIRGLSELVQRLRAEQHPRGCRTIEEVRELLKKWGRAEPTVAADGPSEVKCTVPVRSARH